MSSPVAGKAPKLTQRNPSTPSRARGGSGSSAASKFELGPMPKRGTPRKLKTKSPAPIQEDIQKPPTPSPNPKKISGLEQRGQWESLPVDNQSQASGSATPLGNTLGMAGNAAGGLLGQVNDTAQGVVGEGQETLENLIPLDLSGLKGLGVGEAGKILDHTGNAVGEVVEGEPEDLIGQVVGDDGEILDEDGDLIGRVAVLPGAVRNVAEDVAEVPGQAVDQVTNIATQLTDLNGLPISEGGIIKDTAGQAVGKIVEGDPEELVGWTLNDAGEVLDDDGDLIGRAELLSPEIQKTAGSVSATEESTAIDQVKNTVKDRAGSVGETTQDIPQSVVDSEEPNDADQVEDTIKDKAGSVAGTVQEVPGSVDGSEKPAAVDKVEDDVKDPTGSATGTAQDVPQSAGSVQESAPFDQAKETAKDTTEDVTDVASGDPVETIDNAKSTAEDTIEDSEKSIAQPDDIKGTIEGVTEDTTEDPEQSIAQPDNIKSTAEGVAEEVTDKLPPLSTLEGLKCNKAGKIIDASTGKPVGELVEGDPKKITKLGSQLDDKGQFWDNRGNVIGRVQTIPFEDHEDEPPFAGLEGLRLVEGGWVEDENQKRVGKLVEGDPKKLIGRAVDEDGDVIDKYGNSIAKAEYWVQPDEPQPEEIDLSSLNGLSPNKLGFVIGPKGVPIGRVVEGNLKEVAGKEIDEGQIYEGRKVIGRVELIPDNERESKPEGPFAGLQNLVVNKDGFVETDEGNVVGKVSDGDPKKLRGRPVDEDGDIVDKFGSVKGHAEPYEPPEEVIEEEDLSLLEGKTVNKAGNVVDAVGTVFGRITSGDKRLAGRKVDGQGRIWSDDGKVIGKAELVPGAEQEKPEGAFFGFENAAVGKDGVVTDVSGRIIGRLIEGDAKRLLGRKVDEDGDVVDKNGNSIGRAERWEPEEKKRSVNPMSGRKVTREGEVRDADGNLIGKLTSGNLATLSGKEIGDNGYVVDNDGNKVGECTLLENIPEEEEEVEEEVEEEPGPSPEELEAQKKAAEDRDLAKKMSTIVGQTLDSLRPICSMITEHIEKADRTPREELDEEKLVQNVKPLLEQGSQVLQECNGAIRALDPDGRIAAAAKARAASHEASPEEYALAEQLKDLTDVVVKTIENGKKRIADMPHAKKQLNPLWALLSEPLFQIIAAVGLLLTGVLGLVSRLLEGLGLGGLVRGLLGGLGIDKLLGSLGLSKVTDALGLSSVTDTLGLTSKKK